ncbi:uncharacterized protein [Clytia hemisphaerica]|uniref:uncharacterized protein isoform X3 n=1 Tax=Clytia hemisphaerica TaxID=252671 RepID=UPI0034D7B0CD
MREVSSSNGWLFPQRVMKRLSSVTSNTTSDDQGSAQAMRKISRGNDYGNDMLNITKQALGISNKLDLLNTHRSLVVADTEEKKVQDALLHLVIAKVNASTSLLRWVTDEPNQDLKENIRRTYDINLMWASVQKQYIEQNNALMTSLKDILQIEAGLDALRKHLKEVSDKKERLQQRKSDGMRKKMEKTESISDEIAKLIDEEDSLKSELEVKSVKAEIFKSRSLKAAMKKIVEAHLQLADKMKTVFLAMERVVEEMQEVPEHLKTKRIDKNQEPEMIPTEQDIIGDLAEQLGMDRPSTSSLGRSADPSQPSAIFQVDIQQNGVKLNLGSNASAPPPLSAGSIPSQPKPVPNKKTSGAKLTSGLKKMFGIGSSPGNISSLRTPTPSRKNNDIMNNFNTDFVVVSNSSPPRGPPPDIPYGHRRRSKSNVIPPSFLNRHNNQEANNNNHLTTTNPHSDDDDDDYIEPLSHSPPVRPSNRDSLRQRSKSACNLDETSPSDYGYSRPWDIKPARNYPQPTESLSTTSSESSDKGKYSYAYQHFQQPRASGRADGRFDTYQDPKDCIQEIQQMQQSDENDAEIYTEFRGSDVSDSDSEGLYDLPYDVKEQVAHLQRQQHFQKEDSVEDLTNEDIYQNSLKILDEIDYIDTGELRKIQSRPDASSGKIIVEQKSPIPIPRPFVTSQSLDISMTTPSSISPVPANTADSLKRKSLDKKDISSPMLLGNHNFKDRKMIPVKPIPSARPGGNKTEAMLPPAKLPHTKQFFDNNNRLSHADLACELKTKVKPVKAVPSLTGQSDSRTLEGQNRYSNGANFR